MFRCRYNIRLFIIQDIQVHDPKLNKHAHQFIKQKNIRYNNISLLLELYQKACKNECDWRSNISWQDSGQEE